jgi:hypothetical protein
MAPGMATAKPARRIGADIATTAMDADADIYCR